MLSKRVRDEEEEPAMKRIIEKKKPWLYYHKSVRKTMVNG
jgi:hypothetical protein